MSTKNSVSIRLKKIHPDAITPSYAKPGDAGVDVCSVASLTIAPQKRALVPTGIQVAIPEGYEIQVRPRSGLALKHGISLVNTPGTIDAGYRGEIGIIMINHGEEPFVIDKGMRIAQLVIAKVEHAAFVEVDSLDETERGSGGFGHTGSR